MCWHRAELARDITPGENLKAGFNGFSADGEHFFVTTNERNPQAFDVYEYQRGGSEPAIWCSKTPAASSRARSAGTAGSLLISKAKNNADSDVYLVDLEESVSRLRATSPLTKGTHPTVPVTFDPGRQRAAVPNRRAR